MASIRHEHCLQLGDSCLGKGWRIKHSMEKTTFGCLLTELVHQQIIILLLPFVPKLSPLLLVESAVIFYLQMQQLLANHQTFYVAKFILP